MNGNGGHPGTSEPSKYPLRQYVWALGDGVRQQAKGERIDDRYEVISPNIWRDLTPEQPPKRIDTIPNFAQPYLQGYAIGSIYRACMGSVTRPMTSPYCC